MLSKQNAMKTRTGLKKDEIADQDSIHTENSIESETSDDDKE